ncbi:hypothetical protein FGO68_gene16867 [Halteria grandinella]|uniref:HMG box domain-containing protein n=1 Tax=Halteria grandinella TaxID=5974 RepID=A0A8J8NPA9_HALGN|nr:hypothetical protein FGO68_gene16867 [Halteria grandinella]
MSSAEQKQALSVGAQVTQDALKLTVQFLRQLANILDSDLAQVGAGDLHKLASTTASLNNLAAGVAKHKTKELEKAASKEAKVSSSQQASAPKAAALAPQGKPLKKGKKEEKTGVDALKKPMSAFMIYCNSRRLTVQTEHKELKLTQVTQYIAEEWKALSDDLKKVWQQKAEQAKVEYQLKVINLKSSEPSAHHDMKAAKPVKKVEAKKEGNQASLLSGKVVKNFIHPTQTQEDVSNSVSSLSDDSDSEREPISTKIHKQQNGHVHVQVVPRKESNSDLSDDNDIGQ